MTRITRINTALAASLALLTFAISASAQEHVLRDHLSAVRLTAGGGISYLLDVGATNFNEVPVVAPNSGRCISAFVGDGQMLHYYSAYYVFDVPISGFLNFSGADFRLSFWSNQARMQSDPALQNPQTGDHSYLFDTPVNPNWQTPILTVGGIDVFRFDFDLDAAAASDHPRCAAVPVAQRAGLPRRSGAGLHSPVARWLRNDRVGVGLDLVSCGPRWSPNVVVRPARLPRDRSRRPHHDDPRARHGGGSGGGWCVRLAASQDDQTQERLTQTRP